jgi:hypothetical protein
MAYGTSIKLSNISENWLFKLANRQGGGVFISFKDVTYGSNFYHGVILNKPSIRESIDLKKSVSKTSNMSLNIVDFNYKGSAVSTELFGGTNKLLCILKLMEIQLNKLDHLG